jgi:hypothetical protein
MSAEYTAALIGALGTIAAAFVGVLTWYLTSRADRRHEWEAREAARRDEVKLRDQRVLDLVVALHAEILAGVLANRRQLTPEEAEYALRQAEPFTTPDKTDFVFESLKGDISILPAEVIHAVVQYYRVAMQSNLVTEDLRDPHFLSQPQAEKRKVITFLLQLVELQKILGEAALADLAEFAKKSDVDLTKDQERAIALFDRASAEIAGVFTKSDKSVRKPLRSRIAKKTEPNISAKDLKEK